MKPLCLYHRSDFDGKCSGYIVRRFTGAETYGLEYGDGIPWKLIEDRDVYLVDFSLQPWSEMVRLKEIARKVIWIDHHKSVIETYEKSDLAFDITVLKPEFSACELCWEYFYPELALPPIVRLLGRYDVWDHTDPTVVPFQFGLNSERLDPTKDEQRWDDLISRTRLGLESIVENGNVILKFMKQQNANLMANSFVHEWKGHNWLVVNGFKTNSESFRSKYDPDKHYAVMSFYYMGSYWKVSLYCPDNIREVVGIAKVMGGGGHPFACGFEVQSLEEIGL